MLRMRRYWAVKSHRTEGRRDYFVRMSNILLPSLIKILCVNISSSNPVTAAFVCLSPIHTLS
ncbi:hypothetical protein F2P79_005943 [Pimephales promelas]|nr:hypothetical protein F2P79_005943 [Pimephales promelas]